MSEVGWEGWGRRGGEGRERWDGSGGVGREGWGGTAKAWQGRASRNAASPQRVATAQRRLVADPIAAVTHIAHARPERARPAR